MKQYLFAVSIILLVPIIVFSQGKAIVKGMKISKSFTVKRSIYKIDADDNFQKPVLIIEGNNITVDFSNTVLKGSNTKKNPDEFFGAAIIIQNSKNVTIKNLKVRGYKVALIAKNTDGLIIDNCDFSYNYRQHLNSTQEKEDISDWMSYHQNENDEWLTIWRGNISARL